MVVPILINHDQSVAPIGYVDIQNGRICFKFSQPILKEQVFSIFGNAGILMTETEVRNGELFVSAGEIIEFSV